jgi:hypothetical protein
MQPYQHGTITIKLLTVINLNNTERQFSALKNQCFDEKEEQKNQNGNICSTQKHR